MVNRETRGQGELMAVGRISGPLLKDNLLRDGVNLAFENDLLYLDVINNRIGVKTASPAYDLDINGTTRTTNLEVTTQADIASFTISGNTIASSNGTINLVPAAGTPVVYQAKLVLDDLQISTNTIEITTADTDLNFETLGAGTVNVNNNMLVNGNIHATGNITADGDIQIGSADQTGGNADTITFNAEILSDIIPDNDNTYDLGSDPTTGGKAWRNVFATNVTTTSVTVTDLTVNDTLDVSGTATFNGNVTLGTNSNNTVTFTGTINSDLIPTTNNFYDIGTSALRWADSYFNRVEIDSLVIDNNVISTTANGDDLILSANGAGRIYIPSNDVQIDQALTVDGYTTLHGVSVTGDITQTGAVIQTGDYTQTGNTIITGNLTVSTYGQFEKIRVDGNVISTTATGEDLQLEANTTGKIYVPNNDVLFNQNLTVNGIATIDELSVTNTITAGSLSTGDLVIENNSITTLAGVDLQLSANGTGRIYIPSNDVQIDQALTVSGATALAGTTIVGDVTHTGNVTQTGDYTQIGNTEITGNLTVSTYGQFEKIRVDGDTISSATDTDLKLEANGAGRVYIPNDNVLISQNLTVNGTATISDLTVTNTLTAGALSDGDILIQNNVITTQITNHDLELSANGTGRIYIPSNDVQINQALTVSGTTTLKTTTVVGDVTHTGNVTQTGDYTQTGNTEITGNLTISTYGQFEKIRVDGDTISTTFLNADLKLEASGTGRVYVPNDNVLISQNLTVNGTATISDLTVTNTLTAGALSDGDILIQNNVITTQLTDHSLELSANGSGLISIPSNDVQIDQALSVNGDTTLKATTVVGDINHTGDVTQLGDYTQTGDTAITGNLTVSTFGQFEKIRIEGNTISGTAVGDVILEANGSGIISIPSNDVEISQDLTVLGTVDVNSVSVTTSVTAATFDTGDITIQGNTITTNLTNSNLELNASGLSIVTIPNNDVLFGQALTVTQDLTVTTGTTYLKDVDVTGDITQTGDWDQTGDFTTSGSVYVTGNITGNGDLILPDITISGNEITTTTLNTDLDLRANGTGDVIFEQLRVTNNNIQATATNADITLTPQGTGSVIVSSNQSVIIPVGTTDQRPASPVAGMIRYNTELNRYEGYNASYSKWLQLSGVEDYDGNTKITAELTPGANDNIIRFYANGNLTATIDATKLYAEKITTDGIEINNNSISAINTNTDINLTTAGTGGVKIGNLRIRNNTITNTSSGAVTEFAETGTGYVKIAGTTGVVIPVGDNTTRPLTPVLGMMRFNTFYAIIEVWDGSNWINVAGTASGINITQATELGIVSALLYG